MWISFISEKNRTVFDINNMQFCCQLYSALFAKRENYFSQPQKKDKYLMQRLEQAVTNFQPPPQFKAFINRFERLEDGEPYFLLFNQVDDLTMDLLRNIICILKTDASDIIIEGEIKELCDIYIKIINVQENLDKDYEIYRKDCELLKDERIGEKDKKKRKCIFCDLTMNEGVHFTKDAHVISEGLGNKHLIQNEECDECNQWFGDNYEEDCMNFFSIFKQVYHIRSKHKANPQIMLKGNGIMTNIEDNEGIKRSVIIMPGTENVDDKNIKVTLEEKVCLHNIYKLFCKFALSSLERKKICGYEKTIKWIRGKLNNEEALPMIALEEKLNANKEPSIIVYRRKNVCNDIPSSFAQLSIFNLIIWYYIPYCNDENFTQKQWKYFLDNYFISKNRSLFYLDMNDKEKRALSYKFNFINEPGI